MMLTEDVVIAILTRPPIKLPFVKNYQGMFEMAAGQELEMSADGQDQFKIETPSGKIWTVQIRVNILEENES